ncbi:MAG: hypothetical protein K2X60_11250, partial [Xanthobacteraceae bacterium]|nr:hypothetical protein [Xanthobacteraceae bacterium]
MALSDGLATQTTDFVTRPRRELAFSRRLTSLIGALLRTPVNPAFRPSFHSTPATNTHPYEIDCLRGVLADEVLDVAVRRSREVGIGADRVLIRWGKIEENVYLDHFAAYNGMERERFEYVWRSDCPLSDDHIRFAALHRIIPIYKNGKLVYVKAPEGYA